MLVFLSQLLRYARCENDVESAVHHDVIFPEQRCVKRASIGVNFIETIKGISFLQSVYLGGLIYGGFVESSIVLLGALVRANCLVLQGIIVGHIEDHPKECD